MKNIIFLPLIFFAPNCFCQGFGTSPTNWTLPTGGYIDANGHNYGFHETAGSSFYYNGSEAYSTVDMNGDGKPDLVVTAIGNGTNSDCFGVSSSPYWKVYLNNGTGMSVTATNWTLPSGGMVDGSGHNHGFNETACSNFSYNNCLGWSLMDMNGDSKPDLVVTSQGDGTYGNCFNVSTSPIWKVYLNNGSGFSTSATNWTLPAGGMVDGSAHNYGFNASACSNFDYNNCEGWSTQDMNGDSKPDLVVTSIGDGTNSDCFNVSTSPHWKVFQNNGSGFSTTATTWTLPSGGMVDGSAHNHGFDGMVCSNFIYNNCLGWSVLDMNGDTKPDLVVTSQGDGSFSDCFNVSTSPHWKVYLNNGSGFSTTATNWTLPVGGMVDGSGHNYGYDGTFCSNFTYNNCLGWAVVDLNADSKPDLVVTSHGDGTYSDCYGIPANPIWKVYMNNASGFSTSATNWTLPSGGMVDGSAHNYGFDGIACFSFSYNNCLGWSVFDINGDSKADLVATSMGNGTYADCFGVGSGPHWQVYLNNSMNGIDELSESTVSVFPNPFTDRVNLITNNETKSKIEIFNPTGELVYTGEIESANSEIDLSGFSSGIYFLRISSEKGIYSKKIVKQ